MLIQEVGFMTNNSGQQRARSRLPRAPSDTARPAPTRPMPGAQFLRGLGVIVALIALGYWAVLRSRHLRWGATDEEVRRILPGDERVQNPKLRATHAITVAAPPERVWPWLVQLGQGRGGFYSYDWLENLMGLHIESAKRILPEHQRLAVGDVLPLAPDGFGVPVAILEPGRALVLHGDTRAGGPSSPNMRPGDYMNVTWGFYLEEPVDGTTRLIERFQADYNPSLPNMLFYRLLLEPGSFLMEQKMLRVIKERAERASAAAAHLPDARP